MVILLLRRLLNTAAALAAGSLLLSCNDNNTLFSKLSPSKTNIEFVNKLEDKPGLSILYYLYFYNGGGVATGDINNDGLADIYFTANTKGNNKLYLNKGDFEFEDITEQAGVAGNADWSSGVTMADVNGDGFLDIYVCAVARSFGLNGTNQLFINNGNNSFTESAAAYGLDFSGLSAQAAFFDFDRDGDLDCYLLNQSKQPHANIQDTSGRRVPDALTGDRFYRNELNTGEKKFTDISAAAGIYQSKLGYGLGIAVADLNNDGWDDIYIGNDFHENDYYYVNNGNGSFTESGAAHFRHYSRFSMGNDIADFDNDGQPDVVTVDMLPSDEKILKTYGSDENPDSYKVKLEMNGYQNQYSRNSLHRNNGNGSSFSDIALMAGVPATDWSWSPLLADFDNDGNKDLFVSSGIVKRPVDLDYIRFVSDMERKKNINNTNAYDEEVIKAMPDGSGHPYLFRGNGHMHFTDVSMEWGTGDRKGYYNGAAYADFDNDGDIDLVVNAINEEALLLRNNTGGKNSLTVTLKGDKPNAFGVGTKVYSWQKGKMQYQQAMPTRGFQSASDTRLVFGLDSASAPDSLLVVWPDQRYQVLKNIQSGKPLLLEQSAAKGTFLYKDFFHQTTPPFEVVNLSASYTHIENPFFDNNVQYLIPHGQSTRGPKLAVADVNGDGLDDIYACGAIGQTGTLLVQSASGQFTTTISDGLHTARDSEGVDALFFDADKDGDQDLYVVSGGNEFENGNPLLADHFYRNSGKGVFLEDSAAIPSLRFNKSCITSADIDKDGDTDLFIGGLADARQFGMAQASYLLLNDGKGKFSIAGEEIIQLKNIGMVTAASFADLNKDGEPDLVVNGEWMPVKVFHNKAGKFTSHDLDQSTGLWQSVYAADLNGDGFTDILAGNWGHNSKLWSGKKSPLKLYVKDFDKNGTVEQVLAYNIDGKEYPFLAKDELERALPVLKKAYLTYGEVAGKTVDYIFYDLFREYLELKAETLSSSAFINDGKGGFTRTDLPDALQTAPLMAFTSIRDGKGTGFMAGGNFYNVIPYEGRYDAMVPTTFSFASDKSTIVSGAALPLVSGEIRDFKWLRKAGGGELLVIARNNDSLIFLKQNN
ncbi:VCBS repeat-containing protein [Flavihumibacter stibioxidans]|uniref:ASPIC/UnbV domain-containing protein n=1 Tax=Flavihumibacter stibioxidans TaxID=1834163 RepID=A0ABR7M9D0_9BACT|nr:VCBS repeat-containing protein [Flavihumibacter stibioxidans]MBC6491241.1 hypothetical protein [Flavihumibacter stibioxidans]